MFCSVIIEYLVISPIFIKEGFRNPQFTLKVDCAVSYHPVHTRFPIPRLNIHSCSYIGLPVILSQSDLRKHPVFYINLVS